MNETSQTFSKSKGKVNVILYASRWKRLMKKSEWLEVVFASAARNVSQGRSSCEGQRESWHTYPVMLENAFNKHRHSYFHVHYIHVLTAFERKNKEIKVLKRNLYYKEPFVQHCSLWTKWILNNAKVIIPGTCILIKSIFWICCKSVWIKASATIVRKITLLQNINKIFFYVLLNTKWHILTNVGQ